MFGEASLVTDHPRNASVIAVTFCELYFLRKDDFEAANERFPIMKQKFVELALSRTGAKGPKVLSPVSPPSPDEDMSAASPHHCRSDSVFEIPNYIPDEFEGIMSKNHTASTVNPTPLRLQIDSNASTANAVGETVHDTLEDCDRESHIDTKHAFDAVSPVSNSSFSLPMSGMAAVGSGLEKITSEKFATHLAKLSRSIPEKMTSDQIANCKSPPASNIQLIFVTPQRNFISLK